MRRKAYNERAYRDAKKRLKGLACIYCGAPSDTVEHIRSIASGGDNSPDNLAPACRTCNSRRGGWEGNVRKARRRREVGRGW